MGYRRFRRPLPLVVRRSSFVACDLENPLCLPYLLYLLDLLDLLDLLYLLYFTYLHDAKPIFEPKQGP